LLFFRESREVKYPKWNVRSWLRKMPSATPLEPYCRCSGYRGISVHLLLDPFNGLASAQG
jgi:hypothetical protein